MHNISNTCTRVAYIVQVPGLQVQLQVHAFQKRRVQAQIPGTTRVQMQVPSTTFLLIRPIV